MLLTRPGRDDLRDLANCNILNMQRYNKIERYFRDSYLGLLKNSFTVEVLVTYAVCKRFWRFVISMFTSLSVYALETSVTKSLKCLPKTFDCFSTYCLRKPNSSVVQTAGATERWFSYSCHDKLWKCPLYSLYYCSFFYYRHLSSAFIIQISDLMLIL